MQQSTVRAVHFDPHAEYAEYEYVHLRKNWTTAGSMLFNGPPLMAVHTAIRRRKTHGRPTGFVSAPPGRGFEPPRDHKTHGEFARNGGAIQAPLGNGDRKNRYSYSYGGPK